MDPYFCVAPTGVGMRTSSQCFSIFCNMNHYVHKVLAKFPALSPVPLLQAQSYSSPRPSPLLPLAQSLIHLSSA
jgi:hypothetical protein